MSASFNPYHTWLGIAPDEQPADHYRLLGINRFESDPEVIANAADRQLRHLKTFQNGARMTDCQRIMNELSDAAACLLDAGRKAAYDATLVPPPAFAIASTPAILHRVQRKRPQRYLVQAIVQIVAGGAAGIFIGVMTLNYFWGIDILGRAKKQASGFAKAESPKVQQPVTTQQPTQPPRQSPPPPKVSYGTPDAVQSQPQPAVVPHEAPVATAIPETKDVVEIYNSHNWRYGDRGARICNVQLKLDQQVVWSANNIAVRWAGNENDKTSVRLPRVKFDALRIEVVAWHGGGGGLAEIEIVRDGENVAHGKPVLASAIYNAEAPHLCTPEMVNDGIRDESDSKAGDGRGYWLLPSKTPGWIEIALTQP